MLVVLSEKSRRNLNGVHPYLVSVVKGVVDLQVMDFSVNEGVRSVEKQRENIRKGVSKTMNSKHLVQPDGFAHAVDLYPYPVNMEAVNKGNAREIARFGLLAGLMISVGRAKGIVIKWGYDWDMDGQTLDHNFSDGPHFELVL